MDVDGLTDREAYIAHTFMRMGALMICEGMENLLPMVPARASAVVVLQCAINAARETLEEEYPEMRS